LIEVHSFDADSLRSIFDHIERHSKVVAKKRRLDLFYWIMFRIAIYS